MDLDSLAAISGPRCSARRPWQKRKKIVKRLKVIEAFLKSGNQPGLD